MKVKLRKYGIEVNIKNIPHKLMKFVEKRGGKFYIHRLAALYLVDKEIDFNGLQLYRHLDINTLIKKFAKYDPHIFSKYLIYRDLMDRGYVATEGYGRGIDLLVYDRGDFPDKPPSIRIIGIEEGDKISINQLLNEVYLGSLNKKKIIIAVIERRGEIVYYKLNEFKVSNLSDDTL